MLTALQQLVGCSAAMQQLRSQIISVAPYDIPIHIHGESGVGKELVARAVHEQSQRAAAPFVAINCAAIPEHLVESEYFGHKQGSFSGASASRKGLLLTAQGGSVLLDEVVDLSFAAQAKLLRMLQERRIKAVGADQELAIDIRILSASHKDLTACIAEGCFRADLSYRLRVVTIEVPPLRSRLDDLPQLVPALITVLAERWGLPKVCCEPAIYRMLASYHYPGNVRELENLLAQALIGCNGSILRVSDLEKLWIFGPKSSYFKQKCVKIISHSDLKGQLSND